MNKIHVKCRQRCDIFEVNINQNSARELSLDSEQQLSFDVLDDQENYNLKEEQMRYSLVT